MARRCICAAAATLALAFPLQLLHLPCVVGSVVEIGTQSGVAKLEFAILLLMDKRR